MVKGVNSLSLAASSLPNDHISYQAESEIRQMIKPLEKLFGIKYFNYGVKYPNNVGYDLHTNSIFYDSWLKYKAPLPSNHLKNGWYLVDSFLTPETAMCAQSENLGNFLINVNHTNDKTIVFGFASSLDNKEIIETYRNNFSVLKRFNHYFSQTLAKDIINLAEQQSLTQYQALLRQPDFNEIQSLFESHDNVLLNTLSKAEKEYLYCFLQGYSNIQISIDMLLSPKTISRHISNISKKIGFIRKADLFDHIVKYYFDNILYDDPKHAALNDNSLHSFLVDLYSPISKLSKQEYRCYKLILRGFTLSEISKELGISIPTVADYFVRLKIKLDCMDKKDLFYQAIEEGFMEINMDG